MAPANNNNIEKISDTQQPSRIVSPFVYYIFMHTHYYSREKNVQKVVACCVFENEYRGE